MYIDRARMGSCPKQAQGLRFAEALKETVERVVDKMKALDGSAIDRNGDSGKVQVLPQDEFSQGSFTHGSMEFDPQDGKVAKMEVKHAWSDGHDDGPLRHRMETREDGSERYRVSDWSGFQEAVYNTDGTLTYRSFSLFPGFHEHTPADIFVKHRLPYGGP